MPAVPFEYKPGWTEEKKKRFRDKTRRGNKDKLYDNIQRDRRCDLSFYSTHVREWVRAMRERYPELQETQNDDKILLKSKDGTIILYTGVTVVVYGKIMERFDRDFDEMRENALDNLAKGIAAIDLNNREGGPEEGAGNLPNPANPN